MNRGLAKKMKIGIPSWGDGGFEDRYCAHFGRAHSFIIAEIDEGCLISVTSIKNPERTLGHCMRALGTLKTRGVGVLIVRRIGKMAIKICEDLDITIYMKNGGQTVQEVVDEFLGTTDGM
jgi:predicted Fe-Mo cluster-binding NifX family protein